MVIQLENSIYYKIVKGKKRKYASYACSFCNSIFDSRVDQASTVINSCGCIRKEKLRAMITTHGLFKEHKRICTILNGIKQRCYNPNNPGFKDYGGRNIELCKDWHDVEIFCKWALENGYKKGLTIERLDVNGNYEPNNCTWILKEEQNRNTTRVLGWKKVTEIRDLREKEKISVKELASRYNCSSGTIYRILSNIGYTI